MTFRQFLTILLARKRILLSVLALAVLAALLVSLVMPKSYKATATLVIDYKATDPVSGTTSPALLLPSYMSTQIEIIRSRKVALKVVDDLGLASEPNTVQSFREDTMRNGDIREWVAGRLTNKLDAKSSHESNTITVSYEARDPESAAAFANAFAEAYIQTNVRLNVEPARRTAEWFNDQVKNLRENLVRAQQSLADYQREKGIVSLDEHYDVESARLTELSNQLVLAQAQTLDSRSKQKQTYSGKRIDQLDTDVSSAREREASIRSALERQRALVMELNQQRDKLAILQGDVATAQKVLDVTMQRFSQTHMEGEANQSEVAVLDPATAPLEPVRPKMLRNLAVSMFFGTILAVGVALLAEMTDRRVHEPEDLSYGLDLPVLAVIACNPRRSSRKKHSFDGHP